MVASSVVPFRGLKPNTSHRNIIDVRVGAKLRQLRQDLGISDQRLSEMLGVSSFQVLKYETGVNRIGAGQLHKAAVALGVSVAYFFEDIDANVVTQISPVGREPLKENAQVPLHPTMKPDSK